MSRLVRIMPALLVVVCAGWLGSKARTPRDDPDQMRIHAFGRLPVVYQGRVKPFDTLARNSLVILSDRQTYVDANDERQPAIRWLLNVISHSEAAESDKVFRIENLELLETLGLEPRKGDFRYALGEFRDNIEMLEAKARSAARRPRGQRDAYDAHALELYQQLEHYSRLSRAHGMPAIDSDPEKLEENLSRVYQECQAIERTEPPLAVPPHGDEEKWKPFVSAVFEGFVKSQLGRELNPAVRPLASMFDAYQKGNVETFNTALAEYETLLAETPPDGTSKLGFEVRFNHVEPFYRCSLLYVVAFLLGVFAWLGWSKPLNRMAFWLIAFTSVVHTAGLISRVYISGYPPVTSLYSSAVFIGWGAVILGLLLEAIYRIGVGNIIASVTGFLTLLIAHFLSGDGDTFHMMQAVLDTKFWLTTHVITVTFGYTATYVAGGLGVLLILWGTLTRSLDAENERTLGRMIYGVTCFALLLSFVGTVLGGLWADDSWGRFWGWDPKENGALIIVLWTALMLHARWGGMVEARGLAVLAVFGNIVTSWSWFGVNQLGVGLHSYGFTDSVAFWLLLFVVSQLIIAGIGLLPRAWWRSTGLATGTFVKPDSASGAA